ARPCREQPARRELGAAPPSLTAAGVNGRIVDRGAPPSVSLSAVMPNEPVAQEEAPGLGLLGPRSRHLLALEFGSKAQFDDPRLEWRRLFSELLGTFALVLVAAGGGILHGEGQISLAAAVVAPGLMVMAIILFMGAVSGAHLNPAVSLAFAMRGDFPWQRL